ncbi:MAG: DMT family transporter [Gammaproteobacteria bacterium]|nr:DMT family transporter [Gammaproteobacteria bacterium]
MRIAFFYLSIVLIWSTTPLAFKWSIAPGHVAGIMARLLLASVCGAVLLGLMREALPWHSRARRLYLVSGLSLFLTWYSIGWGIKFIPSGWVAVIFGLTPIMTSIITTVWFKEGRLGIARLGSLLTSLSGLGVIFQDSLRLGSEAAWGIGANVLGTFFYAATMVWMKRINAGVGAIASTTSSHAVALSMFAAAGLITGVHVEPGVSTRALGAIAYLGIVGSIIAYSMFFYLLKHLDPTRIAIISLMTPILSLLIGHAFNDEPLNASIWTGSGLVVLGLLWFEIDSTMAHRAHAAAIGDNPPGRT